MIMTEEKQHRQILQNIAHRVMLERGLLPDFSPEVLAELDRIPSPATADGQTVRDLRTLLWASIDNDDSRDLDQLTVAEEMPAGVVKILVAVADVDALVKKGSAIRSTMLSIIQPQSTRQQRYFPCFRRDYLPTSPLSTTRRIVWPWSSKWSSVKTDPSGLGCLPGHGPQSGQARLQQRGRLA